MNYKQYLKEIFENFLKFLKFSEQFMFFIQKREHVNTLFVKDFRETCQNNRFFAIFLRNSFNIFSKFPNNLFFRPNARKINSGF